MSQSKGSCRYNPKWNTNDQYKDWPKPCKSDSRKVVCTLCDKLTELKKKKTKLEQDIYDLTSASDKLCDRAESTGKLTFLTQKDC
jgi:hypothetical protein